MKTKNILMSLLLVMGAIAAKASGYPPELALVSQPVMVYNYNSITVYYDVENIGDYTYRGDICIYLDPDDGYSYAEKYVKVRPGRIKRIAIEIPSYRINRHFIYTIMPYYSMGRELYSFTTFEYFEPIRFCWHGHRTEPWVVIHVGPRLRYYHRPGNYRYYYDGFRPPMPPHGHELHPMDPMHHTYGFHHNNGGYPATHNEWNDMPNGNEPAPSATVRPDSNAGSMSSGNHSNDTNGSTSSNNGSSSGSGSVNRNSSNSGTTRSANSGSSSGSVNRNSSNDRPNGTTSSSGRTSNSSNRGRVNDSSSSNSRSSGTSSSSSGRVNNSSNSARSSGTNSSNNRSSSSSSTKRSSSSSNSNHSGSSSGRR